MVLLAAACSSEVPHEGGEHAAVPIAVAGCPQHDLGIDGGPANTFEGSELVPPHPATGLICRYAPQGDIPQSQAGELRRQTHLNAAAATELVDAISSLKLRPRGSAASCTRATPDDGVLVAIALSYPNESDVALWYKASGCVSLYNGRWQSVPAGNTDFSTFEEVINNLSPPT
jgi:hypothetical protein